MLRDLGIGQSGVYQIDTAKDPAQRLGRQQVVLRDLGIGQSGVYQIDTAKDPAQRLGRQQVVLRDLGIGQTGVYQTQIEPSRRAPVHCRTGRK